MKRKIIAGAATVTTLAGVLGAGAVFAAANPNAAPTTTKSAIENVKKITETNTIGISRGSNVTKAVKSPAIATRKPQNKNRDATTQVITKKKSKLKTTTSTINTGLAPPKTIN